MTYRIYRLYIPNSGSYIIYKIDCHPIYFIIKCTHNEKGISRVYIFILYKFETLNFKNIGQPKKSIRQHCVT